jgi:aryl-alcohol dehydrogenase-like predicted oxidoreductase
MESSTRRGFLRTVTGGAGLALVARRASAASPPSDKGAPAQRTGPGGMPYRPLGKTGVDVSVLAIGGYHLGQLKDEKEAVRLVHEALDGGVNFLDNAWEYHQGKSEAWLGKALQGKRDKAVVMTKVCTHGRKADVAMKQLEESLRRLRTDRIDLWQIHECIYDDDPERHFAADGVVTALEKAKKQGKVRFVGFTGHKDPSIHLAMLAKGYAFDTCQLPLSCFDGSFRSFEQRVLPELGRRGIAALGMKSLVGTGEPVKKGLLTVSDAIRYVLSLPIASLVSGIDSLQVLRQNLAIARSFVPMSAAEMAAARKRVLTVATDGRFELYKTSKKFDGPPGRQEHGFPTSEKVPL